MSLPMLAVEIDGINYRLYAEAKQATVISGGEYSGEIVIPESVEYNGTVCSVTSIGEEAFSYCSGLTSVTIGNSVTSIGDWAFSDCKGLTSVTIPNSVVSIGDGAFRACRSLTTIKVDENNPIYDSRENCNAIIETSLNTLIQGCKTTTIPNSVTSIGDEAFRACRSLTSVTIGNSVTSIGDDAFCYCEGLQDVYCYAEKVPSTEWNTSYKSNYQNATLHVPAASIESYKSTTPWRWFGKIVALN